MSFEIIKSSTKRFEFCVLRVTIIKFTRDNSNQRPTSNDLGRFFMTIPLLYFSMKLYFCRTNRINKQNESG